MVNDTDLNYYVAEANWPSSLEEAKEFGKEAINKWAFKTKAPKFIAEIDKATSVKRVQEIVIYPLLSGQGLGVIK